MKCHKSNTDQEIALQVYCNGAPCTEYTLPLPTTETTDTPEPNDPKLVECFVPVKVNDELSIRGNFIGTCLHGSFDVIADGAYLRESRIEGHKSGSVTFNKDRKIDIRSVFHVPKPPGQPALQDVHLIVKPLAERPDTANAFPPVGGVGIGSLAVIVSLNQRTDENYTSGYNSLTLGDKDISREDISGSCIGDGGIEPEYELKARPMEGEVTKFKRDKHLKHAVQTRFGEKPWAKMVWHYRSMKSIKEAKCEERDPDDSTALEPADPTTVLKPARVSGRKGGTVLSDDEDEDEFVDHNSLFNTPVPSQSGSTPAPSEHVKSARPKSQRKPTAKTERPKKRAAESPAAPPPPMRKLLGQSLNLPPGFARSPADLHAANEPSADDEFGVAMEEYQREHRGRKKRQRHADLPQMDGGDSSPALQDLDGDGLAGALADADPDTFHDVPEVQNAPMAQMVAPVAQMVAPTEAGGGNGDAEMWTVNEERDVHVKEEHEQTPPALSARSSPVPAIQSPERAPTSTTKPHTELPRMPHALEGSPQLQSSQRSQGGKKPWECKVSVAEIRALLTADGISLTNIRSHFGDARVPHTLQASAELVWLTKRAGYEYGGKYYPNATESSPAGTVQVEAGKDRAALGRRETSPVETIEPKVERTVDQQQDVAATGSSRKRTAGTIPASSRGPTPLNKSPYLVAVAARKAETTRKFLELKNRKAALRAANLERDRQLELREQWAAEEDEREIAEMERQMADDTEEIEAMEAEGRSKDALLEDFDMADGEEA